MVLPDTTCLESALATANREQRMLIDCKRALARSQDESQLLAEICRILVGPGGYRLAWFGFADAEPSCAVRVAAHAGQDAGQNGGYLERLRVSWTDDERGHGPTGRAIRERTVQVCRHIDSDPDFSPWREQAHRQGYRSSVALPLLLDDSCIGALNIYADRPDAFDRPELALLEELAADLAFGLNALRARAEMYRQRQQLERLASFDPLTGLAKRALFCGRLDRRLQPGSGSEANARPVVIAFDVRGLGSLNTIYGQRLADLLLQNLAERLKRYAGSDERIGYLGAGTFVLLEERPTENLIDCPPLALDAALLEEPFEIEGREIRLSVSCGAAPYSSDVASGALLVQRAEAALKRAKECGERYLDYRPEMSRETVRRVMLEHRLRTALEEQQFVLHYQPQIDLVTGKIDAAEALLRWSDPGEGLILPGRFLPVLESSGLIVPLGNWVLLKAVEDLEGWRQAGCEPMRVAVNVSAQQLKQREFLHGLLALAERLAPLAGFGLDIEITETTLLEDLEGTSEKLRELRKAGIRVALDDFGTGYSTLGLLSKLPVDVLKIDRSFVSGLPADAASVTLVVSIVELASAFDLITVAEGVETEEQLAALRALRCSHSQGFLHGAAVPAEELERMLDRTPMPLSRSGGQQGF